MKRQIVSAIFVALLSFGLNVKGYTPAESNAVVRTILQRTLYFSSLGPTEELDCDFDDLPNTWERFLWDRESGGWSIEAKQAAFDDYLKRLGSEDCSLLDGNEQAEARAAINCCYSFARTNSVPYMKTIALNPKGICRQRAIEVAVDFSPVTDEMTVFVETIVTNTACYSRSERGTAWSHYSRVIRQSVAGADAVPTVCSRAAQMYYRNRVLDIAGAVSIDMALLSCIPQYVFSSNRLQTAVYAIDHVNCYPQTKRYFTSVTNELLSSGQPLRQLNIGEDAE